MSRLWSVRMRSATGSAGDGMHLSGAERLVGEEELPPVIAALLDRGRKPEAGFVQLTLERVEPETVGSIAMLPVSTIPTAAPEQARVEARRLLWEAGVERAAAGAAVKLLARGPGPGGTVMRGAMLMDARSGRRLERDPARGVRVTRVDVAPGARDAIAAELASMGLGHHRTLEAIMLASKVAALGAVAELGWSDDPQYTTGYVASPELGYVRLPQIKQPGDPLGGRVYFLAPGTDPVVFAKALERTPVFIVPGARVREEVSP